MCRTQKQISSSKTSKFSGDIYDGYVSFQGINEANRSPVALNFENFG